MNLENPQTLASLIDHTLLKPEAPESDILRLCAEADAYLFATVCVNPHWVRLAAKTLVQTPVRVCTVIGFPLGANSSKIKAAESTMALADGATELDMVINIGALRSGDEQFVREEITALATIAHHPGATLKVILETSLLTDEEKAAAARLAKEANADFVKTSTGFSTGGATVADVSLLRRTVGQSMGVKASGGVRTLAALRQMVEAGATRIGTSSGVAILSELKTAAAAGQPSQQTSGLY